MKSTDKIAEKLKQFVQKDQILTDLEDRYVYSFEKIFLNRFDTQPDIIIRISSLNEETEIKNFFEKEDAILIERGQNLSDYKNNPSKMLVLFDNVEIPTLANCIEQIEKEQMGISKYSNMNIKGYGTHRNIASAVQNLLLGKTMTKCQQCTTCSGYCTVSRSFNGVESWSSKGRMLITRGVMNGDLKVSDKIIEILYSCTKCGLCYAQCFKDLEFHEAILYLRHLIAEKNLAPQVFQHAANNIFEQGDPAGIPINRRLSRVKNFSKLKLPEEANNLCWLGCTVATRTPKTAEAFINILNRSNTEFTMLGNQEGCCGYVLISTGLWEDAKKVAKATIEKIEKTKAQTLITPCSGCYYTFKRLYPEILGVTFPVEILHTSQFLEKLMKTEDINLKPLDLNITYHDPCSLGRHSNIYDPPRNVLKAIPNLNLVEMPLNRECSRCCGGGGGLWTFNNHVSLESTQTRLKEDFIPTNVNILTTACPQCNLNFRFASRMNILPHNSLKIYDITEIFNLAM
ncbi:MAG: (Fe-S)-binding protein [Candidatus Thorarchaeota archaeon]